MRLEPGLLDPATARALSALLAAEQAAQRLPSTAAGLVRGGRLVWADAVGAVDGRRDGVPSTTDTQYRIGSITKTFVAVAIMRLRDAGRLDLSDRFDDHVPGTAFGGATIAQLLSHSSGLQSETDGPWWERTPGGDWADLTAASPVQRLRPGHGYHYTNVGYAALGQLVAQAHGLSWYDVVEQDLLVPLEMLRTTTRPTGAQAPGLAVHPFADVVLREPEHDAGAMAPAGQLWSTVQDLARWAAFLAGDTAGLLSDDTLAEMCDPQVVDDLPGKPWTSAHGLGWQLWNTDGVRYAGHGGSMPGFIAGLQVQLETGDGAVVFLNTTAPTGAPLSRLLLDLLAEREPAPATTWYTGGSAPEAVELVGLWHWGPMATMARATGDGQLELGEPGAGRGSRFRLQPDGTWVGLDGYYRGEPLVAVRDADGKVSHLDLASFRFTRVPYDPDRDIPGGVDKAGWT